MYEDFEIMFFCEVSNMFNYLIGFGLFLFLLFLYCDEVEKIED